MWNCNNNILHTEKQNKIKRKNNKKISECTQGPKFQHNTFNKNCFRIFYVKAVSIRFDRLLFIGVSIFNEFYLEHFFLLYYLMRGE